MTGRNSKSGEKATEADIPKLSDNNHENIKPEVDAEIESQQEFKKNNSSESNAENLKLLLDFCRIKMKELNERHHQLARVFLIFFVLDIVLFLTIFDTRANIDLSIPNLFDIKLPIAAGKKTISIVGEIRPIFVFATCSALLLYFLRFGYLYYQGTRDVINMHSVISKFLPPIDGEPLEYKYIRRGLVQSLKINYIVQTLTVFAFPRKEDLSKEGKAIFEEERLPYHDAGPLADPIGYGKDTRAWEYLTKGCMLLIIFGVAILIAIAQIMILVVTSSIFNYLVTWAIFGFFTSFYAIYGWFIFQITRGSGRGNNGFLGSSTFFVLPIAWFLIFVSLSSNVFLIVNNKAVAELPVLTNKVSKKSIVENSPISSVYLYLLLKN